MVYLPLPVFVYVKRRRKRVPALSPFHFPRCCYKFNVLFYSEPLVSVVSQFSILTLFSPLIVRWLHLACMRVVKQLLAYLLALVRYWERGFFSGSMSILGRFGPECLLHFRVSRGKKDCMHVLSVFWPFYSILLYFYFRNSDFLDEYIVFSVDRDLSSLDEAGEKKKTATTEEEKKQKKKKKKKRESLLRTNSRSVDRFAPTSGVRNWGQESRTYRRLYIQCQTSVCPSVIFGFVSPAHSGNGEKNVRIELGLIMVRSRRPLRSRRSRVLKAMAEHAGTLTESCRNFSRVYAHI